MNLPFVSRFVRLQLRGLCLGAVSVAGLCLTGAQAGVAAPAIAQAPSAVSGAQSYVNTNRGKVGARLLRGHLQGGGGAVAWSVISIYAAGNSGYGKATLVGLGLSDQSGNIDAVIVAQPNQQLYLVASGGYAGSSTYNTAIALSAPLGTLATLPSSVVVNEATTVGSVYALAGFLDADGKKPGTSAGNVTGLKNAFGVFANLVNLSSGTAATSLVSGAAGTPPTAVVNTLADILASCVGSGSSGSSQCSTLLAAATPAGGTAPHDTLAAALDIARNEGNNVAALYALAGTGPFAPALSTVPNDWSVAISYAGGAFGSVLNAQGVSIDAGGNAWVVSSVSEAAINGGNGYVISLSPTGVQGTAFTDNGSVNHPLSVAVDASGNIWTANQQSVAGVNNGLGSISGLAATGASVAGSPFSNAALLNPRGVKPDAAGNVWVLNSTTSFVAKLPVAGAYAPVSYTVPSGQANTSIVTALGLDAAGNVWAADGSNQLLIALSAADPTQQLPGSPFIGIAGRNPAGVGVDASGNVWSTTGGIAGITEFAKSASYAATQIVANDVTLPGQFAFDGAGSLWIANRDASRHIGVTPVSRSGAGLAGAAGTYVAGGGVPAIPTSVAVDPSGNVWLTSGPKVFQLVGAATPVKTPAIGAPRLP